MKQKTGRKLLSFLLTLAMLVGLMPGMGLTAYADNTCTVTFKANGRTVSKEVTLPHTFSCNYSSENGEFDLIIKELYQLDGGCCGLNPPTVSGSTNVTGGISGDNQYITVNAPFEGTATFDSVYFDSSKGYMDFEIHLEISCTGAVAAYSVTITPGSNMTKTSGEASQTGLSGPMTDVVYTANEGYYFPENYSVAEVNGISVTRDSYTQITVSGTPTADAAITLTAPTEKTTPAAPTTAAAVDCTTSDNNDGKLTGVTAAMEYKKSDAADWTAGTGSDITGLVPGTYYVRVKATDTTNASGNQELTINAAQTQTDTLLTTITATDKEKASYNPENVASVSFSYTAGGSSAYLANWGWWGYGWTATVNAAEGYTITKCVFYDDANRKATDSEAPFVVETTEEDKTPRINGTPIDGGTSQSKGLKKIEVYGYATPAATHSVTITAGDNMTKTADSGDAEQTGLTGAMTDVVYTADDGYYFPTDYSVAEVSGIKVTRDSYTQITVSGTPTADAAITLTAPTAKTTPDAPTTAAAENCTTADNNDGKLTGVTTAMEYKKSDAEDWTAGTGSDITGLVPGTYYVRVKATETTNASTNQELTIKGFISYTVTFKVVNGKWNEGEGDAATADKTVTLTGHDGDTLKLTADQIPAVGSKPNDTYKAGSWDTTPSADTEITAATTYTYTYAQKDSISRTVTFKVVNGSWNDETTTDKTVTLTGYEGDTLKLAANQIPAVGSKPNDTYKAGSWDVTPSTETAITEATTYTYTYAQKDSISRTVTFKVVNGSWNDETTTDKTVTLTGYEGDTLKLTADQIPVVGSKPNDIYKAGSWDTTPSADTEITADTTYTYTYAQKDSISQTVTFKVVNGKWDDDSTEDKTVTLTGYEGDTLKLAAADIPAVGTKPNDTYKAGSWDTMPNTDTAITEATTYTYTYVAKEASVVTKAPEAKTLTYNGSAQELVTAGTATGGTMQYALGTATEATQPYTTSIPTKTEAGTYYVWYKVVGDANHNDSTPKCVTVKITVDPKDQEAVDLVIGRIDKLNDDSDEKEVTYARIAYELLTDVQKTLIPEGSLSKLQATEEKIAAEKELADAKKTALAKVNIVDPNEYVTDDQSKVTTAKTTAVAAINAATAIGDSENPADGTVAKALADFNNAIKDCKTQKEADAQALAEAKTTAKTELGNYKKDVVFADEGARAAEVTKGEEVIDDASTVKGVQRALADAKKAIDALKTKAEAETEAASEAAAQLAAAKTSASERLDDYSEAKALADATPEEKAAYDQAVADGKAAIAAAKDPAEVAQELTKAKAAVDAALATINADRAAAAEAAAEMAAADKAVEDAKTAAETAKKAAAEAVANEYATDADKTAVNTAKETLDAKIKAATDLPADATAQQKKDAAKAIEDAVKALNDKVDAANVNSAAAKAAADAEAAVAAQLAAAKNSASERLDDYSEAKALADANETEKAAYDKAVADGKAAIAAAKDTDAVAKAVTDAKAAIDAALKQINDDRAAAAAAEAEMAEADKAVEDAKTAAETAKKAAAEAVANEYATDADKTAVNTAKEALDAKIKAATDLPADATAQQKKDAAKAIEDAVKALNDKVDAANVNSAAAKAAADAEADAAAQLAAAKNSASERLDDYSEAKALADANETEKAAYDKAVADGKAAIAAAKDTDAVAKAVTDAKAAIDAALKQINDDRAVAAAAEAEMAEADKAVEDAKTAAETAKKAAAEAVADKYATDADKTAVNTAKETLDAKIKAATDLPADATAQQKKDAAKAIEDAVKTLNDKVDTANVNSAAAKAAADAEADAAAQLAAAKNSASDRLDDYSEAKALADANETEKAAYDKAVADGKAAIEAAKDPAEVAAALTQAKAAVDDALAKIHADRAAAAAAAEEMEKADDDLKYALWEAQYDKDLAEETAADPYATDDDKKTINDAVKAVDEAVKAAEELPKDATASEKQAAADAIEEKVEALEKAIDAVEVNITAAKAAADAEADAAAQLAAAKNSASDRLDDYSEAKALADANETEKAAYDKAVADGKAAIAAAKDPAEVAQALSDAKAAVDDALAKINADRAAAAAAAEEMAEAEETLTAAEALAKIVKADADTAAADEYASEADKKAISDAVKTLEDAVKAANELSDTATAADKKAAADAIVKAATDLDAATDTAKVNSAAAKAAAGQAATEAEKLAAAKEAAIGRLDDYAELKAKEDATDAEKAEYNQAVADGKAAIEAAEDKDAVAAALTEAKAAVNAALAKIDDDRAKAAEVTEMIDGLSATEDITVDDKDSIEAAREAYEALTEDQKAKVSEETLKKLEDAEATLEVVSKYSNEWVNGKWYNKDAKQNYLGIGKWHKNSKGWWFGDNLGWYAKNQWQKIDGKWYFFDKEGYMEANAYRQGYYLKANGAWDGKAKVAGWKQDSKGWWYSLGGSDFLKNGWKKIDGNWYSFKATGYIAINEFVQGWWLNKTGAWKDPIQCSWHKAGSKWWYGTKDGWYAKGRSYTIDGKKYTFDKKGYTK